MIDKIYVVSYAVLLTIMLLILSLALSYFIFSKIEDRKERADERMKTIEKISINTNVMEAVQKRLDETFLILARKNNTQRIDLQEFQNEVLNDNLILFGQLEELKVLEKLSAILKSVYNASKIHRNTRSSVYDVVKNLNIENKNSTDKHIYIGVSVLLRFLMEKFPEFTRRLDPRPNEYYGRSTSQDEILRFIISYIDNSVTISRAKYKARRQAEIMKVNNPIAGIVQPIESKTFFGKKTYLSSKTSAGQIQLDSLSIFFETLIKKLARLFMCVITFGRYKKLNFFFRPAQHRQPNDSVTYDEDEIYQNDKIERNDLKGVTVQNGGHATNLIQFKLSDRVDVDDELRIITDPTFYHLNALMYRSHTRTGEGFAETKTWDNMGLDVIVISHNHRDHFDEKSLKVFAKMKIKPIIVVPLGLKARTFKMLKKFGFREENIVELSWGQELVVSKGSDGAEFSIVAVPADHWSGSNGLDTNHSATNGYLISSKNSSKMVYYAGDTAKLNEAKSADLLKIVDSKSSAFIPQVTHIIPAGPNYNRNQMNSTHQSAIESLEATLRLTFNIANSRRENPITLQEFGKIAFATPVIFTHHNKYELGPDRYNEGLNVLNKLSCALFDIKTNTIPPKSFSKFAEELISKNSSSRDKFVYEGARDLFVYFKNTFPNENEVEILIFLGNYVDICINNSFLKIGEKLDCNEMIEKIEREVNGMRNGSNVAIHPPVGSGIDVNQITTNEALPQHAVV